MKDLSKKRLIVVGLGFSVFLVLFFVIRAISASAFSYRWFYGDDGLNYISFSNSTFYEYVFGNGRPASYFFIWLAFRFFGNDINALLWVYAFFFALPMTVFFFLVRAVTKENYFLTVLCLLPAFLSRLNWYYFISILGIMESVALLFLLLSVLFLFRFIRERRVSEALFSSFFYLLCIFSHERFIAVGLVLWVFFSFLLPGNRWKKGLLGLVPLCCFLFFFFFKVVLLQKGFWVVSADRGFSNDVGVLFSHFIKCILNCFTLYEEQAFYSGLSNSLLTPLWSVIFYGSGVLLCLLFLIGFVYVLFSRSAERWIKESSFAFLFLFFTILVAASVSPDRVEMRWVYPAHCILFLTVGFLWNNVMNLVSGGAVLLKKRGLMFFLVCSLSSYSSTYVYSIENRGLFYLVDDNRKADLYYDNIILPFLSSGSSQLVAICNSENRYLLESFFFQFGIQFEIVEAQGLSLSTLDRNFVAGDYIVDFSHGGFSHVEESSVFNATDFWIEELWSFFVFADSDFIPVNFDPIRSPDGRYNTYSIEVNHSTVLKGDVLSNPAALIPLERGTTNVITIRSGFTWNPHDLGLSEDIRNLGLHVSTIGGQPVSSMELRNFWIGKHYSSWLFFNDERFLVCFQNIEWPFEDNTYKINLGSFFTVEGSIGRKEPVILEFGPLSGYVQLDIFAGYTWNPHEMGASEDRRDLGLFINYLGRMPQSI